MKNKLIYLLLGNKNLFDITTLAFDKGKYISTKELVVYSLILTYHPAIAGEFKQHQKSFIRLSYPQTPDMEILWRIDQKLSEEDKSKLKTIVNNFIQKYRLSLIWETPIKVKLLTDVLPIPYNFSRIEFSYPTHILESAGVITTQTTSEMASDIVRTIRRTQYPCIVITESVRPKNICEFVKKNWSEISTVVNHLPKRQFKKVDVERFALGVWTFIKKEKEGLNWTQIEEEITAFDNKDENFFGNNSPSLTELQKCLDDTKNYFNKITPV